MTYTPGPWNIARNYGGGLAVVAEENERFVCDIIGAWSNPTAQKDAHLIAAAPDLYDALDQMWRAVMGGGRTSQEHLTQVCRAAEAALAKARGEVDA